MVKDLFIQILEKWSIIMTKVLSCIMLSLYLSIRVRLRKYENIIRLIKNMKILCVQNFITFVYSFC
jgi:hypothetical protein